MKVAAMVLALLVSFALVVPIARANDGQVLVARDVKDPSPEYVKFASVFTRGLDEQFQKSKEQNLAEDWIVFLSPIFSTAMVPQVTIIAIRAGGESERPILIAVLNENSPPAVIRTAVKSTQRVLSMETRQQRQQRLF